jgi:hypothetical protein
MESFFYFYENDGVWFGLGICLAAFFFLLPFSWGLCVGVLFFILIDVRMLHVDTLIFVSPTY